MEAAIQANNDKLSTAQASAVEAVCAVGHAEAVGSS